MPLFFCSAVDEDTQQWIGAVYLVRITPQSAVRGAIRFLPPHVRAINWLVLDVPVGESIPASFLGRLLSKAEMESLGLCCTVGEWKQEHGPLEFVEEYLE